jgi:hypothetical protein
MAKFLPLALWNANGRRHHTEEQKTFISVHNIDVMLISKGKQLGNHRHQNVMVIQTQVKTLQKQQTSHT